MPVIPQKALSPEGGRAEHITVKLPRGWRSAVEHIAQEQGMTKSEYIRSLLVAEDPEVFALASQEVSAAS